MESILVEDSNTLKKVNLDDIYYFTRDNYKSYAVIKDGRFVVKASLNYIGVILDKNFIRTHKSYVVNINKIDLIIKSTGTTYNITFKDINSVAIITKKSLKMVTERLSIL